MCRSYTLESAEILTCSGVCDSATQVGAEEGCSLNEAVPDTAIGDAWHLSCSSDESEFGRLTKKMRSRLLIVSVPWVPPSLSFIHGSQSSNVHCLICGGENVERSSGSEIVVCARKSEGVCFVE